MNNDEQQVIDELFGKVRQAEQQSGPRDPAAEEYIRTHVTQQPAAPYYMAQAIVVQEEALKAAQTRIEQLEREVTSRPAGGGFLGSLFGGGTASVPPPPAPAAASRLGPGRGAGGYGHGGQHGAHHGSGFLGGALQTAMAVAGGVIVGNMLADLLMPGEAAAEPPPEELPPEEEPAFEEAEEMSLGDEEF